MTEERLNEIRAMVNTGFIPAPGNATVAQLLEYSDSLEEQNKRLQNANQSLRRTLTREALKDANYNVEIMRLRKELKEAQRYVSDLHHHAESLYQIIQRGDLNTLDLTQADREYDSCYKINRALGQEGEGNQCK